MNKITKTLKAVKAILKKPWLLNLILADDVVWYEYLKKNHGGKKALPILEITDLFPDFAEELSCFAFLDGGSLPTDLALLKSLCRKFSDCTYFEIGTWRGESVTNVAEVAKECTTLNLSKQEILALGLDEKYADLHAFFSKDLKNVTHLKGNSKTFDFKGLNKKFDVVFIDGDHSFEAVKHDTAKVFDHLLHDNSIVVWHDYGFSPEKVRPEILAAILEGTPKDYHKHLYHVSNSMCAIMVKGEFRTTQMAPPLKPNKTFQIDIRSTRLD